MPIPMSTSPIRIHGRHFLDSHSRVVHLRGVNLSGSSKVPSSSPLIDIENPSLSSYVNQPFTLQDAPTHWKRLKRWGLAYLRVTVTWEAIEHAGPGVYDEEYLCYLRKLLESMTEHGLVCYVCMHQDVWSRLSGGSGAPGWTLYYAGFDLSSTTSPPSTSSSASTKASTGENSELPIGLEKLEDTGAAYVHGIKSRGRVLQGDRGLWPTGYNKLACATMNTLFWAGKTFAPSFYITNPLHPQAPTPAHTIYSIPKDRIDERKEIHIQDFLQERYLAAFGRLVEVLNGVDGVLGFEMMNEPHPGYIGMKGLHNFNYNTDLHLGMVPSPLQSFSSGAGHPTPNVPVYTRTWPHPTRISSHVTLNSSSVTCWLPPDPASTSRITESRRKAACPWEREGVWAWDRLTHKAIALKEGYFAQDPQTRRAVDFMRDFYLPFVGRWEKAVRSRSKGKEKMLHVEGLPNEDCPDWPEKLRPTQFVFSPHWYDLKALFGKSFGTMSVDVQGLSRGMFVLKALYLGKRGAKKNYAKQIRTIVDKARERLGEVPLIIGETGIPIDMNGGQALRNGNFKWQERMMDALISALEASMVGFNLWTYNPANSVIVGDDWNSENFSWYSDGPLRRKRSFENSIDQSAGLVGALGADGHELDMGGRLLSRIVRPYALRTAGIPVTSGYDSNNQVFRMTFANPLEVSRASGQVAHPPITSKTTEIFLPAYFSEVPNSIRVSCSDGTFVLHAADQCLKHTFECAEPGFVHEVEVSLVTCTDERPKHMRQLALGLIVLLMALWFMMR